MQNDVSIVVITRVLAAVAVVAVAACAKSDIDSGGYVATPTVDYVERLDVYSAPHRDSFLNQLAMNYRSYAIYNARTSGFPDVGELFANKAVSAFSGETPFPESLDNWVVDDEQTAYELTTAYNDMIGIFQNDGTDTNPEMAAELQAKYDCWLSATATGQSKTANECRTRFMRTLTAIRDCAGGKIVNNPARPVESVTTTTNEMSVVASGAAAARSASVGRYYPETAGMSAMRGVNRAREGVIIVNNVNVPEHLINPEPVQQQQPLVFNQNIYGGDKEINKTLNDNRGSNSNNNNTTDSNNTTAPASNCPCSNAGNNNNSPVSVTVNNPSTQPVVVNTPTNVQPVFVNGQQMYLPADGAAMGGQPGAVDGTVAQPVADQEPCECADEEEEIVVVGQDLVTRREFINMMMAMRAELAAINARLDALADKGERPVEPEETTIIKVQQIPVEPKQHVMEEVFEIRFDFDKATIKPEYQDLIRQLVDVTQNNRNVKVSVVGHTDTAGSQSYNYALGGRRAEAVQKMLISYGIPSSQIVAVSAGEEDLKVPTPDGVPNAENRRVRVVKETTYTEPGGTRMMPVADVSVMEYVDDCGGADCDE